VFGKLDFPLTPSCPGRDFLIPWGEDHDPALPAELAFSLTAAAHRAPISRISGPNWQRLGQRFHKLLLYWYTSCCIVFDARLRESGAKLTTSMHSVQVKADQHISLLRAFNHNFSVSLQTSTTAMRI
jgi:hypothetical protein